MCKPVEVKLNEESKKQSTVVKVVKNLKQKAIVFFADFVGFLICPIDFLHEICNASGERERERRPRRWLGSSMDKPVQEPKWEVSS